VDEQAVAQLREYAARRLPGLSGDVTHASTCLYTNTPDRDFIVDAVPGRPGVFLISACSGHGFKFTILMGRVGADLAAGRLPRQDLSRFALSRFAARSKT
jgi:glycine/D-amino acid oxidase-like deaminating enzyme